MNRGHFYFITDQYFNDFKDDKLMQNKEVVNERNHNRPSFFAFEESSSGIFWLIPISSQVDKFKTIYNNKVNRFGKCDTIAFGLVLGHEKAFLIQNMCPVTKKYVANEYLSNNTPVTVNGAFEKELVEKAKKVLHLVRKGYKNLVFPDVLKIEQKLLESI